MKAIHSNKEFNDLVKTGQPFVLDFYADWCGPCQSLLPIAEKVSAEYEGKVAVLKVNIDEQKDLATKFKVRSIPAIFFLEGNKILDNHLGLISEVSLKKKIKRLYKI